jgi:hypothetical protein
MIKRYFIPLLVVFAAQVSHGEILEIYTWKPHAGKAELMLDAMQEAAEIHSGLGIGVTISQLAQGTTQDIDYVLRYDDLESWGALNDSSTLSAEWNTFFAKFQANPHGELVNSFSMVNHDQSNMADDWAEEGQIVSFFRWEPALGLAGQEALRQGFMTAKEIHEALGARVETYQVTNGSEGVTDMMYLMIYDGYSEMAEVNQAMQTSPEWLAFQQAVDAQPSQAASLLRSGVAVMAASYD